MKPTPQSQTLPIEIDVFEVKRLLDSDPDVHLIDCRESDEFEYCKIENASLIPMNETPERLGDLESHKDARIVVYCHHGGRSHQVVQYLRSQGFSRSQNMTGGIEAWSQQIDSSIPQY